MKFVWPLLILIAFTLSHSCGFFKQLLRCFSSLYLVLGFSPFNLSFIPHPLTTLHIPAHTLARALRFSMFTYLAVLTNLYASIHLFLQPAEILIKITLSFIMFSYTLTILLNQIHHPPSYITSLTYPLHPLCHILSRIVYLPLHATMPKYFSSTFTWIKTYTPVQALIEGSQKAISISITTLIILTFHTPPHTWYLIP